MANVRILVVEDEIIVAKDIQQTLTRLGYEVPAIATSGEAAITQTAAVQPDLILMDIRLRGAMDGVSAAGHIQRQFDLPVVYLTAHSDTATLQRVQPTAPYGYILKPFNERELYVAVETALYRHKVEDKLKRMEQWLAATLKSIGDAVIATDPDGLITFMNPVAEALTGWTEAEALGQPLPEVFVARLEPTQTLIENPVARVLRDGMVIDLAPDTYLVARDGRMLAISDSAAPIRDEAGTITGVVLVFRDVTEHEHTKAALRSSEARYRLLADHSHDLIGLLDRQGHMLYVSPSHAAVLGVPADDLLGQRFVTLIHPDDRGQVQMIMDDLGHTGTSATCELRLLTTSGDWMVVEAILTLIMDATTDDLRILFSAHDITGRKRAEVAIQWLNAELEERVTERTAQLAVSNQELEQSNQAKDRFLATMSHELRTPLNAIIGFTGTLLMRLPGPLTTDQERQLGTVQASAKHLLSLISDILDLTKIESGKVELNWESVICQNAIRETVTSLSPLAETKGVTLDIALPDRDIVVRADQRALSQILINLVNNAIKFTERGNVRIELSRRQANEYRQVEIRVVDTGVGIRPEDQAKLFQAFTQVDTANTRRHEGTGLGLYVSQKLAELLGGQLTVQSTYGVGSTFTLSIPA